MHRSGILHVRAGQAVVARAGKPVQYSTPESEGADYIAVCLLAGHCPSGRGHEVLKREDRMSDVPAGRYRHYKGNDYTVIGVARHSETEEELVVYPEGVRRPQPLGPAQNDASGIGGSERPEGAPVRVPGAGAFAVRGT